MLDVGRWMFAPSSKEATGAAVGYGDAWASGRFSASVKVSASK
jgi:hypothetical protein